MLCFTIPYIFYSTQHQHTHNVISNNISNRWRTTNFQHIAVRRTNISVPAHQQHTRVHITYENTNNVVDVARGILRVFYTGTPRSIVRMPVDSSRAWHSECMIYKKYLRYKKQWQYEYGCRMHRKYSYSYYYWWSLLCRHFIVYIFQYREYTLTIPAGTYEVCTCQWRET